MGLEVGNFAADRKDKKHFWTNQTLFFYKNTFLESLPIREKGSRNTSRKITYVIRNFLQSYKITFS